MNIFKKTLRINICVKNDVSQIFAQRPKKYCIC